jgi:glycerol dehydrogenase-like iron-containing ADH family enzyme
LIFSRYGWTESELLGTSFDSFPSILLNCVKAKQQEQKQAYIQSAFIGWQIQELVKGALNEKAKPQQLSDYLKQFGLSETEKQPMNRKQTAQEAIAIAEAIRKADQKGRGTDGNNSV